MVTTCEEDTESIVYGGPFFCIPEIPYGPLKGREEKSTVKSCEKCYIRHPRYAGHSKGSDKSRKEETGSPLFLLGFVERM